jgi:hypothetical protein
MCIIKNDLEHEKKKKIGTHPPPHPPAHGDEVSRLAAAAASSSTRLAAAIAKLRHLQNEAARLGARADGLETAAQTVRLSDPTPPMGKKGKETKKANNKSESPMKQEDKRAAAAAATAAAKEKKREAADAAWATKDLRRRELERELAGDEEKKKGILR